MPDTFTWTIVVIFEKIKLMTLNFILFFQPESFIFPRKEMAEAPSLGFPSVPKFLCGPVFCLGCICFCRSSDLMANFGQDCLNPLSNGLHPESDSTWNSYLL